MKLMPQTLLFYTTLLCVSLVAAETPTLRIGDLPALPMPLTNNAVTTVSVGDDQYVVSFNGLGSTKSHADTLDTTFVFNSRTELWRQGKAVPGGVGRLASVAESIGELAYVFGGYTVAADGTEVSTPWSHSFNPVTEEFSTRKDMPIPVDDAVAVPYKNRFIYLVSGWHDLGNVNLVQRYDTSEDSWAQATPIPGSAVFGHAGGIVGNQVVYCDGVSVKINRDAAREFVANSECYIGKIDERDSRRIDWRTIDYHPGAARYRMAAAGIEKKHGVLFIGGSTNPYNYDGIGYDGSPSNPSADLLFFDLRSLTWQSLRQSNEPTMDHRGLASFGSGWLTVGGMLEGQQVIDSATIYSF